MLGTGKRNIDACGVYSVCVQYKWFVVFGRKLWCFVFMLKLANESNLDLLLLCIKSIYSWYVYSYVL
jgi:hypothetical protein